MFNLKWLFSPPVKFYSDYTAFEKAWWGLWRRPADLLTKEQVLELNKELIIEITKQTHSHSI